MKHEYYELDPEEEEILKAFEEGKLVRVKDFAKQKNAGTSCQRRYSLSNPGFFYLAQIYN